MVSQFWSPIVHKLDPYVPGEQPQIEDLVKLNTNENPYPPSPKVTKAIVEAVDERLRLYPDPQSKALRQCIADYYQVDMEQVFVGNGSDEVLAHIFQGLFQHDLPILFPDISYSFYPVYCGLYQIEFQTVPLAADFSIQVSDYQQANGGIIFPNPNAPTGRLLSLSDIAELLGQNQTSVVVIDEAYIDFGGESAIALVNQYPNLLVTQTLSKSRSLAGMRLGYAIGHADLIAALVRVKDSFNSYPIDSLASVAGMAAFEDESYFQKTRQQVIDSRDAMMAKMTEMGFDIIPSAANFIFVSHPEYDAMALAQYLREQGVIVRHFNRDRIAQYLRITIGDKAQNQRLLSVLSTYR